MSKVVIGLAGLLLLLTACTSRNETAAEGMITVISDESHASESPFAPSRIVTETGTGALTITQVIGPEVTLKDAHGGRHTFNVLTDAFS